MKSVVGILRELEKVEAHLRKTIEIPPDEVSRDGFIRPITNNIKDAVKAIRYELKSNKTSPELIALIIVSYRLGEFISEYSSSPTRGKWNLPLDELRRLFHEVTAEAPYSCLRKNHYHAAIMRLTLGCLLLLLDKIEIEGEPSDDS